MSATEGNSPGFSVSVHPSRPPGPMVTGDPCTLVIFGCAGDLAKRKLVPSVYELVRKHLADPEFRILGVGVESHDDASCRAFVRDALQKSEEVKRIDEDVFRRLAERIYWISGDLTGPQVYTQIAQRLASFEEKVPDAKKNRLFYLSVPPFIFEPIVKHLKSSGLAPRTDSPKARPWRRVIVEKPFGRDLKSAEQLSKTVLDAFAEHQIYRIDHYVGKETVQNVLVFRSANAIFEALWSREHIASVQITAAETVGVEARAKYYESSGVVRDMFQNHLLQLVALTAMEPPAAATADAIRDEKVKILRALHPLVENGKAKGVRAQYAPGMLAGKPLVGYREEPDVSPTSTTPTYAALKVMVDNDRWRGVPFYVRSGKRMAKRHSEIAIQFKLPKKLMYEPCPNETLAPNMLVLRVQPNDGVSLSFEVKVPGAAMELTPGIEVTPVDMDFSYASVFGSEVHPAYETLLLDCMIGDATLFTRTDEVEAAWKVVDPIIDLWEHSKDKDIPTYAAGSWGPKESDDFLAKDGFAWRKP
jgi:glucose-6-phosphate 1-dehydrogenase